MELSALSTNIVICKRGRGKDSKTKRWRENISMGDFLWLIQWRNWKEIDTSSVNKRLGRVAWRWETSEVYCQTNGSFCIYIVVVFFLSLFFSELTSFFFSALSLSLALSSSSYGNSLINSDASSLILLAGVRRRRKTTTKRKKRKKRKKSDDFISLSLECHVSFSSLSFPFISHQRILFPFVELCLFLRKHCQPCHYCVSPLQLSIGSDPNQQSIDRYKFHLAKFLCQSALLGKRSRRKDLNHRNLLVVKTRRDQAWLSIDSI